MYYTNNLIHVNIVISTWRIEFISNHGHNEAKQYGEYYSDTLGYDNGFRTFDNAYLINNVAEGNLGSGYRLSSTDVYLDSNQAYNNDFNGFYTTSSGGLFVGNSAFGNVTANFDLDVNTSYGQILSGTATTDQPFANFGP